MLWERDQEIESLGRLVGSARSGTGGSVVIEGDAGIGKTGLVRAACDIADGCGVRVLRARGAALESDLAFGVVRELFAPVAADLPDDLDGAAALALPVLAPGPEPGPDARTLFAVLHGLHWLTADLGAERPVLLVVDDVHWSDLPSLRFLAYLARRVDDLPVALLVTSRPSISGAPREALDAVAGEPVTTVLYPRPLSGSAVAALVSEAIGSADPEFADACLTATGGNPFLLGELLAELRSAGVAPRASEVGRLALVVPHGVQRAVTTRLSRLSADGAALSRAAAVLGDGADARRAARLAGLPDDRVLAAVDELAAARLVERDVAVTFLHPLLRTAVASTLGPGELAVAHRRAATMLHDEGERGDALVPHLLAAQTRGDPWIVETLRTAARRAMARGAPELAARYLRRALAEPPPGPVRHPLTIELGIAEMQAGAAEATTRFATAVDEAPDVCSRARAQLLLARTTFHSGRLPEAVDVCERALSELDGADPELAQELEVLLLTAATGDVSTRPIAVRRLAARGDPPEPTSRAGCMLLALLSVEEVMRPGSRERAVELAEKALTDGHLFDDHAVVTLPSAMISMTLSGAAGRAGEVLDHVIDRQRRRGDVQGFAFASAFRGHAAHHDGDLLGALAHLRRALELCRGEPLLTLTEGFTTAWLACALIDTGDLVSADAELAVNPALTRDDGPFTANFCLSARGRLRLAQERYDEAVSDLEECGRRMDRWDAGSPVLSPWRPHLALALRARGEQDRASDLAGDALRRAREWGEPAVLSEALRIAATVTPGRDGRTMVREAVDVAATAPLERARALTALGTSLRREGDRTGARAPLREAIDLALARGATGIARAAHDELVATGARPRRLRATGAGALTPTERRVAAMAADGMTNRAVAQALFVSEKTVETHLGHAYRKLGITARSQLAGALASGGSGS